MLGCVRASSEAVIHQVTALPTRLDWGNPHVFDEHNRVRTEGARILVDAARTTGATRVAPAPSQDRRAAGRRGSRAR